MITLQEIDEKVAWLELRVKKLEEKGQRAARKCSIEKVQSEEILDREMWGGLKDKGHDDETIRNQFVAFKNHALSVDRRCVGVKGWRAAFRNWMRRTR